MRRSASGVMLSGWKHRDNHSLRRDESRLYIKYAPHTRRGQRGKQPGHVALRTMSRSIRGRTHVAIMASVVDTLRSGGTGRRRAARSCLAGKARADKRADEERRVGHADPAFEPDPARPAQADSADHGHLLGPGRVRRYNRHRPHQSRQQRPDHDDQAERTAGPADPAPSPRQWSGLSPLRPGLSPLRPGLSPLRAWIKRAIARQIAYRTGDNTGGTGDKPAARTATGHTGRGR